MVLYYVLDENRSNVKSLSGLVNLEKLFLNLESCQPNFFDNLSKLRYLHLAISKHTKINLLKLYDRLPNLEVFIIFLNFMLPIEFENFSKLKYLRVYTISLPSQFETIRSESIRDFSLELSSFVLRDLFSCQMELPNLTRLCLRCKRDSIDGEWFQSFPNLKELNLNVQEINEINSNDFQYLQNLQVLKLQLGYIEELDNDIFFHLSNLKSLDLSGYSNLRIIHPKVFSATKQLEKLDVSSTPLFILTKRLEGTWFRNLSNLIDLIARHCQLTSLNIETLSELPKLRTLDLSSNRIEISQLNLLKNLSNLKVLRLVDNRLEELVDSVFSELFALEMLDLSYNRFRHLRSEWFHGLTKLQVLNLDYNQLETFSIEILNEITTIRTISLLQNHLNRVAIKTSFKEFEIEIFV